MKELEVMCGDRIENACERLARVEAPAFMVFNDVRVEARVGETAGDLHARWSAEMDAAREVYDRKRKAHEATPEGQRELAEARERAAKQKRDRDEVLRSVAASGVREKHPWTDAMGEISGFGGGYENACRDMVYAGLVWVEAHPGADLSTYKTPDAKALDAHILAACPDCTGAMHGAAMNAIVFISNQGWDVYAARMTERSKCESA